MFEIFKLIKLLWKTPALFLDFLSLNLEKIIVDLPTDIITPLTETQTALNELLSENLVESWTQFEDHVKEREFWLMSFPTKQMKTAVDIFKKLKKEAIVTEEQSSSLATIHANKEATSISGTTATGTPTPVDAHSPMDFLLNVDLQDSVTGLVKSIGTTGEIQQIIARHVQDQILYLKSTERPGSLLIQTKVIPLQSIRNKPRSAWWESATHRQEVIVGKEDLQANLHLTKFLQESRKIVENTPGCVESQTRNNFMSGSSNGRFHPYGAPQQRYNGYPTQY